MNKKNKTKKTRKLLPVLLCIVLILSMFTLSAFAEETECEHQYYARIEGVVETCDVECLSCGALLPCRVQVAETSGLPDCQTEWSFAYVDYCEMSGDVIVAYVVYQCNCESQHMEELAWTLTPIVDTPEAENKSIITSITTDLVGSIGVFLGGIGESLLTFFDTVVTTTNAEGKRTLTMFAGWSIAFLGIGFGSMFIRKLMKKAS